MKTDITKRYVGWAVQNGFQVIDVNIPKMVVIEDVSYPTSCILLNPLIGAQDDGGYVKAEDNDARAHQTKELAGYIWENYIE
jgi:histone deacetylase 6